VGELARQLALRCAEALESLDEGPTKDGVSKAMKRLDEPLRIAIVGRVSTGKSTILNALLERRIAPTAAGECTQLVTWYRSGSYDSAQLRLADGSAVSVGLPRGRLPEQLDRDLSDVERIEVALQNEHLDDLIIIDTPGLDAATVEGSERTETFLGTRSRAAASQADAVIYVLTDPPNEVDRRVIEEARMQVRDLAASAFNTVGVVNMADRLGGVGDPDFSAAEGLAARCREELHMQVGEFVPMSGLLAQAATTDLREADVRDLRELAALPADQRELMLVSADYVRSLDVAVPPESRERLLQMLDLFGLARSFEWIDAGGRSAVGLREELGSRSGVSGLWGLVRRTLAARADILKAQACITELRKVAYGERALPGSPLHQLRGRLDDLESHPEAATLRCARALGQIAAGEVAIEDELVVDIRNLALGTGVHERLGAEPGAGAREVRELAARKVDAWREYGATAWTAEARRVARAASSAYQHLLTTQAQGRVGSQGSSA
jgi:hypothetical protein